MADVGGTAGFMLGMSIATLLAVADFLGKVIVKYYLTSKAYEDIRNIPTSTIKKYVNKFNKIIYIVANVYRGLICTCNYINRKVFKKFSGRPSNQRESMINTILIIKRRFRFS